MMAYIVENKMVFKKERRKILARLFNWFAAFCLTLSWPLRWAAAKDNKQYQGGVMKLPLPKKEGTVSDVDGQSTD